MPLVRISHSAGKPASYSEALSQGVHSAMIDAFGIPEDDFFHIITDHVQGSGLCFPRSFLKIGHGNDVVIVQITVAEDRTTEQNKALYSGIVDRLVADPGVPRSDVIINLVETKRENWSFGNGEAPFA